MEERILKETSVVKYYTGLVRKFSDYQTIKEIVRKRVRIASRDEIVLLLETGIYLLTATGRGKIAMNTVQRWIKDYAREDLIMEIYDYFQEQKDAAYHKRVSGFLRKKHLNLYKKVSIVRKVLFSHTSETVNSVS